LIPDLLDRYKKLVDLAADSRVFPAPDIYRELAAEWFHTTVVTQEQISFIMAQLKKELDKMSMFEAMHNKFNTHR
jgi:hypothetical protein